MKSHSCRHAILASILCVLIFVVSGFSAFAAGAVAVQMKAEKVAVVDGKESLQPAEKALPGDLLQYTATYHNYSSNAVANLAASLPIPVGTELVAGSATPPDALASLDGKKFLPMPLKRMVKVADGTEREEDVPLREYRVLRWNVAKLAADQQVVVSARVRVLTDLPVTVKAKPTGEIRPKTQTTKEK